MLAQKNLDFFNFITTLETGALIFDLNNHIIVSNETFDQLNSNLQLLKISNKNEYLLESIDTSIWQKQITECISIGQSRFQIQSNHYEFNFMRLNFQDTQYIFATLSPHQKINTDSTTIFSNDLRVNQLKNLSRAASNIAHEINNPLTVIVARAQILKMKTQGQAAISSNTVLENIEKISSQSERIKTIVNGIQALSRDYESNEKKYTSLKLMFEEAYSLVHGHMRNLNIKFNLNIDNYELKTLCRPTEIIHLFVNLLNNSIQSLKETPNPEITVDIIDDNHSFVLLYKDNGPGISNELENKMFSSFIPTQPTEDNFEFRLKISSKIAETYGGHLELDRSKGPSCFKITFSKNTDAVSQLKNIS